MVELIILIEARTEGGGRVKRGVAEGGGVDDRLFVRCEWGRVGGATSTKRYISCPFSPPHHICFTHPVDAHEDGVEGRELVARVARVGAEEGPVREGGGDLMVYGGMG